MSSPNPLQEPHEYLGVLEPEDELFLFEVSVPVAECWIMRVVAKNAAEALEKASAGAGDQLCTISGNKEYVKLLGPFKPEEK